MLTFSVFHLQQGDMQFIYGSSSYNMQSRNSYKVFIALCGSICYYYLTTYNGASDNINKCLSLGIC